MASSNSPPQRARASLAGPAGALEALIETPAQTTPQFFGVICHPHSLYGGTLENKVVHTLARSFQSLGAATIRFNFRGVGASTGSFGEGLGETEDTLAVIEHGRKLWPGAALWLAGFSFGGAVAIRTALRTTPQQLITVAPAVRLMDLGARAPECPWLIIQGDADELVAAQTVLDWAAGLDTAPTVTLMPGVGHFFHGRLRELQEAVTQFSKQSMARVQIKNPVEP